MFLNQYDLYNYELELEKLFMMSNVLLNEYLSGILILNYIRDKDNPWTKDLIIALDPTGELQRREYVPSLEQLDSLSEEEAKKYIVSYEGFLGKIFQAIINFFKAIGRFIGKLFNFGEKIDSKLDHIEKTTLKIVEQTIVEIDKIEIKDKNKALEIINEIVKQFSDDIKVPEYFYNYIPKQFYSEPCYDLIITLAVFPEFCNKLFEIIKKVSLEFEYLFNSSSSLLEMTNTSSLSKQSILSSISERYYECIKHGKISDIEKTLEIIIKPYCIYNNEHLSSIFGGDRDIRHELIKYGYAPSVLDMIKSGSYQQNKIYKKIEDKIVNPTKNMKIDKLIFDEEFKSLQKENPIRLINIIKTFNKYLVRITQALDYTFDKLEVGDDDIKKISNNIIDYINGIKKNLSSLQVIADTKITDNETKEAIHDYINKFIIPIVTDLDKFCKFILYELTFYMKLIMKLKDLMSDYFDTIGDKFRAVNDLIQEYIEKNNIQET